MRLAFLFLFGIILCGGCSSIIQQEQAIVDRLGLPSLAVISSGDIEIKYQGMPQEFLQNRKIWQDSTRRYYYLDKHVVVVADSCRVSVASIDHWQYYGVVATLERIRMSQSHPNLPASQENNEK